MTTKYVRKSGSDSGSVGPFLTITYGLSQISGGDTLIVGDGAYAEKVTGIPTGSAGAYTTLIAENLGGVTIGGPTVVGGANSVALNVSSPYVIADGFRVRGGGPDNADGLHNCIWVRNCHHVKVFRCCAYDQHAHGNDSGSFVVGQDNGLLDDGSDSTYPTNYVLFEDCWTWGYARYKLLSYEAKRIIFRRCVARHDYMDPSDGFGMQCALFAPYASIDVVFENCIGIDSGRYDNTNGGMYGVIFGDNHDPLVAKGQTFLGCIALNYDGKQAVWDPAVKGIQHRYENCVWWHCRGGYVGDLYGADPGTVLLNHCTFGDIYGTDGAYETQGQGQGTSGGFTTDFPTASFLTKNSLLYDCNAFGIADQMHSDYNHFHLNGANYGHGVYGISDPSAGAHDTSGAVTPTYICRIEAGDSACKGTASDAGDRGANVVYRYGVDGTLWGETGYDTLTATVLWPFPNEALIRADMRTYDGPIVDGARGFCAEGETLTHYIWNYLGNGVPAEFGGVEVVDAACVTQAATEVALVESVVAAVRVSQAALDVVLDEDVIPAALVSQAIVEVVVLGDLAVPPTFLGTTYASVDLPDPSSYYGGYKDGRVLSFGTATRTVSDLTGQWSANDLSCTIADTDRSVRQVLTLAKRMRETPVIVRMIADADRRALLTATMVFRGALRAWKPRGDLAVELEFTDAVGSKLARRGKDRQLPSRVITATDFPLAPSTSQALPVPIIYGEHVWWTGACPVIYVGVVDLISLGVGRDTWVVAGHACKAITKLYVDGVEDTNWGTGWFASGQSGWPHATPYVDINGRRYTVVVGQGPAASACAAGTSTLRVNVKGVESMGDGSGALMTQSYLQYLHFFRHFVLSDYQGGSWPVAPLEWAPGWSQINEQSFVDGQAESRRWVPGDGYTGMAYIGPAQRTVRDWLAIWNTSLNCRLGMNRSHQWTIAVLLGALDAPALAALPRLSDAQDVLRGSFSVVGLEEEAITRATVSAYHLPADDSVYGGSETYVDRQAELDSGEELAATLKLDFLGATPQTAGPLPTFLLPPAEDVAKRWIGTRSGPPLYRVTFESGLCAYEAVDVGDLFRLTHFAGTTGAGWLDRIIWCESLALDIDRRVVTIVGLDVTHIYEGSRTLEEIVDPPGEPGDPDPPPPIEGESPMAPASSTGAILDATLGSAYYGSPSTTVYYKIVALFDSGEESKPAIVGPLTTGAAADNIRKRANLTWSAYPTGAQTGRAGGSVLPTAIRVYRCADAAFLSGVVKCDLTKYPLPEAPGNLNVSSRTGIGTTYTYAVSHWYYLVGEGPKCATDSCVSGATPRVDVDWWDDALIDATDSRGIFEAAVWGRTGDAQYLDNGWMGNYFDNGDDTPKSGSPWASVTPGVDLPLSATSFYDLWPGKADEANNPWVTV